MVGPNQLAAVQTQASVPCGIRTAERPALEHTHATAVGPGEYTAVRSWASASAPVFGHRLKELRAAHDL